MSVTVVGRLLAMAMTNALVNGAAGAGKASLGARTYLEAYFAENMVAIPPHNFCTQISIRKPYGIYNQNFKRKVVGWNGGGVL